ncbi:MAG: hypothetical protein CM15mP91_2880 [Chloroflexota bacterium]|nr:MAG: hypothetical protein CM15mP91_2880 [Chloroflexota bacterium]
MLFYKSKSIGELKITPIITEGIAKIIIGMVIRLGLS